MFQVLRARNALAHNSSMTLKDNEFILYTYSMLQLLYDMKKHQETKDLVIAIHEIEKVSKVRVEPIRSIN